MVYFNIAMCIGWIILTVTISNTVIRYRREIMRLQNYMDAQRQQLDELRQTILDEYCDASAAMEMFTLAAKNMWERYEEDGEEME